MKFLPDILSVWVLLLLNRQIQIYTTFFPSFFHCHWLICWRGEEWGSMYLRPGGADVAWQRPGTAGELEAGQCSSWVLTIIPITSNSKHAYGANGGDMTDFGWGVRWACVEWNELNDGSCIALSLFAAVVHYLLSTCFTLTLMQGHYVMNADAEMWLVNSNEWHIPLSCTPSCVWLSLLHMKPIRHISCVSHLSQVAAAVRHTT